MTSETRNDVPVPADTGMARIREWLARPAQSNVLNDICNDKGMLYFLTPAQAGEFVGLYNELSDAKAVQISKHKGFVGYRTSIIMKLRNWLRGDNSNLGVEEKECIRAEIEYAMGRGSFIGISPSSYSEILANLSKCPDVPDVEAYKIQFHL